LEHGNNFEEKLISRLSGKGFLGPASSLKEKSGKGEGRCGICGMVVSVLGVVLSERVGRGREKGEKKGREVKRRNLFHTALWDFCFVLSFSRDKDKNSGLF